MVKLLIGDCRDLLKTLPSGSVHCCVTSPPYFCLRDYGVAGQIGLEQTPEQYVAEMVAVFREVRRVLRDDGTLWLNLGDSYAGSGKGRNADGSHQDGGKQGTSRGTIEGRLVKTHAADCKPKDLIGIPWRVAFALQADGWYLRQDIIWHKPNPMPESVRDRCTKAHEYVFLLAKSPHYYYDNKAIMEPAQYGEQHANKATSWGTNRKHPNKANVADYTFKGDNHTTSKMEDGSYGRNRRSVWTVNTQPYSGAHFATFPQKLIEPCILAGCPAKCCPKCGMGWNRVTETITNTLVFRAACLCNEMGCGSMDDPAYYPYDPIPGTVLDPFGGSGTTGAVASANGRSAILIELNSKYTELVNGRCGLFLSKD